MSLPFAIHHLPFAVSRLPFDSQLLLPEINSILLFLPVGTIGKRIGPLCPAALSVSARLTVFHAHSMNHKFQSAALPDTTASLSPNTGNNNNNSSSSSGNVSNNNIYFLKLCKELRTENWSSCHGQNLSLTSRPLARSLLLSANWLKIFCLQAENISLIVVQMQPHLTNTNTHILTHTGPCSSYAYIVSRLIGNTLQAQ